MYNYGKFNHIKLKGPMRDSERLCEYCNFLGLGNQTQLCPSQLGHFPSLFLIPISIILT